MKIAYLLESTSLWGGVKVVFSQARSLLKRGHSVEIISHDEYPTWVDDFVPYRRHDPLDPDVLRQFDCVIATFPKQVLGLFSYPDILEKSLHLVQGYEGDSLEGKPFIRLIEDCYSLPIPKLTVSKRLAERLGKMFPGRSFYPIGQGIEHRFFFPSGENARSSLAPVDRIFLIGPLHNSIKDIPVGLNAYSLIRREYPSVKLVRISQFNTRSEEEDLVGLIEDYHVNVRPREVGEIMRSGRGILISPSGPGEGFGLPALEAMATGIPSVLTAIPSYLALSDPCDYAVFVPHNSSEAMAQAVCRLMKDERGYMRLTRRGREVASLYSFEKVAGNLEAVFLRLCSG
jgi:glycosyltransferase involved in cell wall biosynthesis